MLKQFGQKINDTRWIRCVCIYTKKWKLEMVTMSKNYYYLISLKYHLKVYSAKLKMCTINPDATTIIKDL